jgi:hypothetical protein
MKKKTHNIDWNNVLALPLMGNPLPAIAKDQHFPLHPFGLV